LRGGHTNECSTTSASASWRGRLLPARLLAAIGVDIDDAREPDTLEREPAATPDQLAARGDQATTVVDDAPRLVAQEIRVEVRDAERARALDHEPLPHGELAEREVARRRVEQDVGAAQRQVGARAVRDPGVLADLEADPHVTDVEHEIADRPPSDRPVGGGALEHVDLTARPRLEPARLVVDAVAGEELLRGEPDDLAVGEQRRGVVQRLLVIERQADGDHHARGERRERLELRERGVLQAVHEERVLAGVPGDRELRQTQQRHALAARLRDRLCEVREVLVPRKWRLVDARDTDLDEPHDDLPVDLRCSIGTRRCCRREESHRRADRAWMAVGHQIEPNSRSPAASRANHRNSRASRSHRSRSPRLRDRPPPRP
jgi:hypothetical protein